MRQHAPEITAKHVTAMLSAAERGRNPRRDVALIRLAAEVGARPSELAAMTWRDVCDAEGAVNGRARWQTSKGGERREVELSPATTRALAELRSHTPGPLSSPLFVTERRGAFTAKSMSANVVAIARRAGIEASAYSLRHLCFQSAAEDVIAVGGTQATLVDFTGHRRIDSVGQYLRRNDAARKAMDGLRHERCAGY